MEKSENIMGTKKVMPLLISMSVPPMISMLIQALYNIVDSMYGGEGKRRCPDRSINRISSAEPYYSSVLWIWNWIKCLCGKGIRSKR